MDTDPEEIHNHENEVFPKEKNATEMNTMRFQDYGGLGDKVNDAESTTKHIVPHTILVDTKAQNKITSLLLNVILDSGRTATTIKRKEKPEGFLTKILLKPIQSQMIMGTCYYHHYL